MNSSCEDANRSLARLRRCLDVYSAALVNWQQTMDEASAEIASLTPSQARQLAGEIDEIEKNRLEYAALKRRVEAGWAIYRQLSARFGYRNALRQPQALSPSARTLN